MSQDNTGHAYDVQDRGSRALLGALPCAAHAQIYYLMSMKTGQSARLIDRDSIRRQGDLALVISLSVFLEPIDVGTGLAQAAETEIEIDCNQSRFRNVGYAALTLEGAVIGSGPQDGDWNPINTGTEAEDFADLVCRDNSDNVTGIPRSRAVMIAAGVRMLSEQAN